MKPVYYVAAQWVGAEAPPPRVSPFSQNSINVLCWDGDNYAVGFFVYDAPTGDGGTWHVHEPTYETVQYWTHLPELPQEIEEIE